MSSSAYSFVYVYDDVQKRLNSDGIADVIILVDGSQLNMAASNRTVSMLKGLDGFDERLQLSSVNGYSGMLSRKGLSNLIDQGYDATVYENTVFYAAGPSGRSSIGSLGSLSSRDGGSAASILSSSLNISTSSVYANYSWNVLNVTGRNVSIAIIDTGVDYTHPDLGGCFGNGTNYSCKIFGGYDFIDDDYDPMDDFGHGTELAGIIAADGQIRGVAPDSRIYALRVCGGGQCPSDAIALAMEWAKNQSIQVVSISLGIWVANISIGNSGKFVLSQEVSDLTDAGVITVIAAGNSGPGVSTILSPADAPSAITVGAIDDKGTWNIGDDSIWRESSRGPSLLGRLDPDISAPGYEIITTDLGSGYYQDTGTSMAAPFVSAGSALLLERYPLTYTPLQIRAILMQTSSNINENVFAKGSGELNIMQALDTRMFVLVNQTDTYDANSVNDRWEFIAIPTTSSVANFTVYNDNDYEVSFNLSSEDFMSMENNSYHLDKVQLKIPSTISVPANSTLSFQANFTIADFSSQYATTYGGLLNFNGSGYNGSESVSKSLIVPIIITVPITDSSFMQRTLYSLDNGGYVITNYPHDDIYSYCYYDPLPRNLTITINWSSAAEDLDLFLYHKNGDVDTFSGNSGTSSESVFTTSEDRFKWFRIDGFDLNSVPFVFDMNISPAPNNIPIFVNITDGLGFNNGTLSNPVLIAYRPDDMYINISYYDADKDWVNVTLNDSNYTLVSNSSNLTSGYGSAYFKRDYNSTIPRNSTIKITLSDGFGNATRVVNMMMYSSINIISYSPDFENYIKQNDTLQFAAFANDMNGKALHYYWSLDGSLNSTNDSSAIYNLSTIGLDGNYTVSLFISNNITANETNETISWLVHVDSQGPQIAVQSPQNLMYNGSRIDVNFTAKDTLSATDGCWYVLNSTGEAFGGAYVNLFRSLPTCSNSTLYLVNGNYTLNIYANDTVSNSAYSASSFSVNDTTMPNIISISPNGTLAYTTSITMSVTTDENSTCRYGPYDENYSDLDYSFNDNISLHSISASVDSGAYTNYVRCIDMSNNSNNESAIITFTVSENPPSGGGGSSGSGSGGSGGSSGSGGGAGGIGTYPDSDSTALAIVDDYSPGESGINVENDDIPIDNITLDMKRSGNRSMLSITRTFHPEHNYTELTYSYLLIEGVDFDMESMNAAKIYFNIKNEWLISNNISRDNVVLMHYDDITQNWSSVLTEYLDESYNSTYYVAHIAKFGLFAVTHNATRSSGTPPVMNMTREENRSNKTNSTSSANTLASSSNSGILGQLSQMIDDIRSGAGNLSGKWIISILLAVFVAVIIFELTVKKQAGKVENRFKEDLISSTEKVFSDSKATLIEKVPAPKQFANSIRKDAIDAFNVKDIDMTKEALLSDIRRLGSGKAQDRMDPRAELEKLEKIADVKSRLKPQEKYSNAARNKEMNKESLKEKKEEKQKLP